MKTTYDYRSHIFLTGRRRPIKNELSWTCVPTTEPEIRILKNALLFTDK